ncbi:THAP domain-containing protein 1-like [Cardiocondyla obscurior]|uniref:THAP domain-containing protein 1-like n=1 Tax=Cardiocondyla obscurior TaxID=286306 RepID=UPI0039656837
MPKRCVVLNCPSATSREKCMSHFFRFPQVEAILVKWIEATGRNNWIPTEASVICDLHFKKNDFTTSEIRRRLKSDVIPSLYIHNVQTVVQTEVNNITECSVHNDPLTEVTNNNDLRKRKASDLLQDAKLKINKLEDENKNLRDKIQFLEKKFVKEYETRINKIKSHFQQQQQKSENKLHIKNKQLKILRVQVKRKDCKVKELLTKLLNMNLLSNTAHDTLLNNFENIKDLFINESKNKNISPHGRRYSTEVKKFAVTLHYHSPKAYEFCSFSYLHNNLKYWPKECLTRSFTNKNSH